MSRTSHHKSKGVAQEKTTKGSSSSAPRKVKFDVGTKSSCQLMKGPSYQIMDVIGEGAYGVVASGVHIHSGTKVAIKKIVPFEHTMFALRTLRELKLLKFFAYEGVCENAS
jgi:mitogen-activated protein kinase 1/3